jgi:diguanylate cyclase (GGDEF)-like protein
MESQELLEQLKKRIDGLKVFSEIGKTVTSTLDINEVLKTVLDRISEILSPTSWSLLYIDEQETFLRYEILINEPYIDGGKTIAVGEGIPGWVAQHRAPVLWSRDGSRGISQLPQGLEPPISGKSLMCVPLQSRGRILGVMDVRRAGKDAIPFDPEDLVMFSAIADYAAIAIENARNYQRVEDLTITDDLSGLFNIRHLHAVLEAEILRAAKYKNSLSMVFLDLDHFKKVNDTHGHMQGSRIIRETGRLLMANIRMVDYAFRYGGDEFAVVLPETPKANALLVGRRLCATFDQHRFLQEAGIHAHLTASLGVAAYPNDARTKEDLIRMADQAMYGIKRTTRNGVKAA